MENLTFDLAQQLLDLPKEIVGNNKKVKLNSSKNRFLLFTKDISEYKFLFDISNNQKRFFKISLHHQESNTHKGLLRVDFNGGHKNPPKANENVPLFLRQYEGQIIEDTHIHFVVEGYKDLAWAMPLNENTLEHFSVFRVNNFQDFREAILSFSKKISLKTQLDIPEVLL